MTQVYVHSSNGCCYPVLVEETATFSDLYGLIGLSGGSARFWSVFQTKIDDEALVSSYVYGSNDFFLTEAQESCKVQQPASKQIIAQASASSDHLSATSPIIYQPIPSYSWEDKDSSRVILRLPFINAKSELKDTDISTEFAARSFTILVGPYRGFHWKFSCQRTHGPIESISPRISKDSVVLTLNKAVQEPWFDLFKKKAVGDADAL